MATLSCRALALVVLVSGLMHAADPAVAPVAKTYKWVYISHNFDYAKNVDEVIKVLERAAKAGYNGIAVTDCKFARWFENVTVHRPGYDDNVRRLRKATRDLGLACYVFTCDETSDLLSNDPNLAEGMPVIGAPFVVRGGTLVAEDDGVHLQNASFEASTRADQPTGWFVDEPGTIAFIDKTTASDAAASLRFQDPGGKNARAIQKLAVKPFRYYHASAMVKTANFVGGNTFDFTARGKQGLAHQSFDIKPTQDWTRIDIVFNTLDSDEVSISLGTWGAKSGSMWIDDLRLEPGGLVNLIRRDDLPFAVTSVDGKTVYAEGKDFADAKDPKMGNTDWPGLYKYWYEQPVVRIPPGSALKEGDRVLVDYSHAMMTYGYGVFACMNEPKIWPLIERNLHELHTVLEPDGYILPHDELRHQGWDATCQAAGKPMATVLGENVQRCVDLIHREDAGKPIFIWSDMFDPYHNATKKGEPYYLVKGIDPWNGSWKTLDKDITVLNWNGGPEHRRDSMRFFADRGNPQILCGFYDNSSDDMTPWLAEGADIPGIAGVMYTTWGMNFTELEKFLEVVDRAKR